MTESEFRSEVGARVVLEAVRRDALETAMKGILKETSERPERRDVQRCIEWAGIIAETFSRSSNEENQSSSHSLPSLTPGRSLRSDELMEAITPWVEQVRTEIFGSSQVPFSSYKKAVAWIEATAQETPKLSADEKKQSQTLRREIREKARILTRLTGVVISSEMGPEHHLSFPGKNGQQRLVLVWRNRPLMLLADASRKMETATNFSQALIVAHILAGVPLLLPSARTKIRHSSRTLPTGEILTHYPAFIEFPSLPDLTLQELTTLYRMMRQEAGLTKAKKISERDTRLCAIVSRLGGVPRTETGNFWRKVFFEYNKKAPRGMKRWTDWNAPRMAYQRLQRKLSRIRPGGA